VYILLDKGEVSYDLFVGNLRLHIHDLMADVLKPRKTLLSTLKQSSSIQTKKEDFAGMKCAFEFFGSGWMEPFVQRSSRRRMVLRLST
jgi:hypothetical protein